jgi:hypothetical protein
MANPSARGGAACISRAVGRHKTEDLAAQAPGAGAAALDEQEQPT